MRAFFTNIFAPKKIQSQYVSREKLIEALLFEKFACKKLINLTPYLYGAKSTLTGKYNNMNDHFGPPNHLL